MEVKGTILLVSTYKPLLLNKKANYKSFSHANNHFVTMLNTGSNFAVEVVTIADSAIYSTTSVGRNISFDDTYNIRTIADNSAFLVYNSTTILKY
jgi:hypothetical protein